jgi:hypothetical protein
MGTDPHSQPGSAAPAVAAAGTASAGRLGNTRAMAPEGTKAAIAPLTATPRTRNGIACTVTATNTVVQFAAAGQRSRPPSTGRSATAARISPTTIARPTSGEAGRREVFTWPLS